MQTPSVFTVAAARDHGMDERSLRDKSAWARPFRGMRAEADAEWADIAAARARAAGPGVVLFGPSALRAWGLEMPGALTPDPVLHLAVAAPTRAPRGGGVTGYSIGIQPSSVTTWCGIRLTTRERTWVDLARWLSVAELVAVGDRLCFPRDGWCTLVGLESTLDLTPRVRGVERLRAAMGLIVPGAESYPESQLRVALEAAGLPRAAVNVDIVDGRAFVARVDMLFAPYGVVVEYEGAHHAVDTRQWRRDLTRIGDLQRLGYIVERAHADDLKDPTALIARVRVHLLRRGWSPTES